MKNYYKTKSIILLIILSIVFLNNISHAINETSNPKIETRDLIFNIGKSSDQIRFLKDFFRAMEVADVPLGYSYDKRTKQLVRDYQELKGLEVDGFAGNITLAEINKEIKDKNYKIGLYIPHTNIKGDIIIINKSSNTLYFMKGGVIQESYPVATGKSSDLTPDGKFKIVVKYKNPNWGGGGTSNPIAGGSPYNPLGTRWIGISYGGGGLYGVHGNSDPGSIGTYASLGCIRMFNRDVEKLYEKVNINIPIWIGNENLLESYGVKFKSNYKEEEIQEESHVEPDRKDLSLKNLVVAKNDLTDYPFYKRFKFTKDRIVITEENKRVTYILNDDYIGFLLNNNL